MRAVQWLFSALIGCGAALASAQGPVGDAVPGNPCRATNPKAKPLKLVWIANEAASDGLGAPAGPGNAETMVICHSTEKTGGKNIDVVVEMYDSGGANAGFGFLCDVAPGATAGFVTFPLGPPYIAAGLIGPAFVSPPGSLRILATKPKIVCDVTLYDTLGPSSGFTIAGPMWSKDVTLTKAKAPQKGD